MTQPTTFSDFQARVSLWMTECFGPGIAGDLAERNYRFLEEALELVQANGGTAADAHALVDYVFGRAPGLPFLEVGGTMVTLAALCLARGTDLGHAATAEVDRISTPAIMERIRNKHKSKPIRSPLPGEAPRLIPDPPAAGAPIPMRLNCPSCGELHIDEGVFETKPHTTHACQHCGMVWRPAILPTVGVRFLPGFKNEAALKDNAR